MRFLSPLLLACVVLAPLGLRAEDAPANPDGATAHLPKHTDLCVRLPALDRIDALAKDMSLVLELFAGPQVKAVLAQGAPSEMMLGMLGIDGTLVDRTKPLYLGTTGNDPIMMMPPAAGAKLDAPLPLMEGHVLTMKDGLLLASRQAVLDGETRADSVRLLPGDFAVHIFAADLTERHHDVIEAGFAQMGGMMGMMPMPGGAEMGKAMVEMMKGAVYSVDSIDYALTWQGEGALAEGRIDLKAGSGFRKLLSRAGTPADSGLAAFLPKDALIFMDAATTPDWPSKEITEFANGNLGPQFGAMLQQSLALGNALQGSLTGHAATSIAMQGFMGVSVVALSELKEEVDTAALFEKVDVGALNEGLKKAGVPMAFKIEMNVAKHGETSMHRWTFQSDNPQIGMMAMMMQTYVAAEDGKLVVVTSQTGETDMREALDRIRAGGSPDHPHLAAMASLGRGRNYGITLNVGQLKSLGMMIQMFSPEAAQALSALPDVLTMSTSISFEEGNIHWRGNWPLKQIGMVVDKIRSSMEAKGEGEEGPEEVKPEKEEDFK